MNLTELANKYNTDKGTNQAPSMHGYTDAYDLILAPWRKQPLRVLEVGVVMEGTEGGHSIKMWLDYFPNATLFCMDIVDIRRFESERVKCFQGSGADPAATTAMYAAFGSQPFDLIIEDGSHKHDEQVKTFEHLWSLVASGGYYFWEDILNPLCRENHERLYLENQASHKYAVDRGARIIYDMLGRFETAIFEKR